MKKEKMSLGSGSVISGSDSVPSGPDGYIIDGSKQPEDDMLEFPKADQIESVDSEVLSSMRSEEEVSDTSNYIRKDILARSMTLFNQAPSLYNTVDKDI